MARAPQKDGLRRTRGRREEEDGGKVGGESSEVYGFSCVV